MEDVYLAGEPNTNSEASLIVGVERNSTHPTDPDDLGYDEDLQFDDSIVKLMLHVAFDQVDMRTGGFSRVIRPIELKTLPQIELNRNELIDRNDHFGLILSEPDP